MKSKAKILRDIFATGHIGHMEISVATEPRLVVKTAANQFILSARTGRTRGDDISMVTLMRSHLTHDIVSQKVTFAAVDRQTLESETGEFKVIFRGYYCEEAQGSICAGRVVSHIHATTIGAPQTAESLAGLENAVTSRIIYNIPESKPCTDMEGYDRKLEALHATVWLNSNDGSWYARRTEAGKATMGKLAEVGMDGLTAADILDAALLAAPKVSLEH